MAFLAFSLGAVLVLIAVWAGGLASRRWPGDDAPAWATWIWRLLLFSLVFVIVRVLDHDRGQELVVLVGVVATALVVILAPQRRI